MDENTLKKVVEEVVKPLKDQIGDLANRMDGFSNKMDIFENKLGEFENRLDSNTGAIMELEKTVKGYADSYKLNDTNIRKVAKRVETLEDKAGMDAPEELQLAAMSDI